MNRIHKPYIKFSSILYLLLISFFGCQSQSAKSKGGNVVFKKVVISAAFVSEGAATSDINKDGKIDIVAGNYWFEAPGWKRHLIHADTLFPVPGYSTTFLNFCSDVNNDGWIDLIRFDQPGGICIWYENPASKEIIWKSHIILDSAGIESPAFVDVDLDGRKDIICNDPHAKKVIWLKSPSGKGDTTWQRFSISNDNSIGTHRYTHGLGWGDINGDGRNDVIIRNGWWESPADVKSADWKFHPGNLGKECSNMFAFDFDQDGDADVVTSSAHNYGVWWYEQRKNSAGEPEWVMHEIDRSFSQSHAIRLEDIDNDGHPDLVTGKRYLAHHDGSDVGSFEPAVLYWFEFKPGKDPSWIPHLIDDNSGIGNSFVVEDINKDKLKDIIVSNKKGVFLFEQVKN